MCPVTLVSQLMPLLLVWHHPKGAQALRNRPGGKEGGRGGDTLQLKIFSRGRWKVAEGARGQTKTTKIRSW